MIALVTFRYLFPLHDLCGEIFDGRLEEKLVKTALVSALLTATGCAVYPDNHGRNDGNYGPPPHSAKHGYQQSYGGHEVRYDANLRVYLVGDMPNYNYLDNQYYRYNQNRWYYSQDLNRDWRDYDERNLPSGLANKYAKNDKYQNKHHDQNRGQDRDRDH